MSREPMNKLVAALKTGAGLKDEFIYHMSFDDYKTLPDPYTRTIFTVGSRRRIPRTISLLKFSSAARRSMGVHP